MATIPFAARSLTAPPFSVMTMRPSGRKAKLVGPESPADVLGQREVRRCGAPVASVSAQPGGLKAQTAAEAAKTGTKDFSDRIPHFYRDFAGKATPESAALRRYGGLRADKPQIDLGNRRKLRYLRRGKWQRPARGASAHLGANRKARKGPLPREGEERAGGRADPGDRRSLSGRRRLRARDDPDPVFADRARRTQGPRGDRHGELDAGRHRPRAHHVDHGRLQQAHVRSRTRSSKATTARTRASRRSGRAIPRRRSTTTRRTSSSRIAPGRTTSWCWSRVCGPIRSWRCACTASRRKSWSKRSSRASSSIAR